jgi:hypothetical protein
LDGGGVLLSSENPLDRTGKAATAERLRQPVRVMDLKPIVDIQTIKEKDKKESFDVQAFG